MTNKTLISIILLIAAVAAALMWAFSVHAADCSLSSGNDLGVSAGSSKDVDAGESVKMTAAVDGDYDRLSWSCTGGELSDKKRINPTFTADEMDEGDNDRMITCTLTARNDCQSASDSVEIRVHNDTDNADFGVTLTVGPHSGCAPQNKADLQARLDGYDLGEDIEYTYKFDCTDEGTWDKTVDTEETSYTANGLCEYRAAGNYTARVSVSHSGRTATDTSNITIQNCQNGSYANIGIEKFVANTTTGTQYLSSVSARPGDTVAYKIIIRAQSGDLNDIVLRDNFAPAVTDISDIQVNGGSWNNSDRDLAEGIDIGTLKQGQTAIITYSATLPAAEGIEYGQNVLASTATAISGNSSRSATTTVYVGRKGVLGATAISTGVGSNITILPFLAGIIAAAAFAIKKHRINI